MPEWNIKLTKILDFLDDKILEIRKDDALGFMSKITAYNLIIDLQEFIKDQMEEAARGTKDENGVHYPA